MKKVYLFIFILLSLTSCDEWLDQIEKLEKNYAYPKYHENGVDPEKPHNAMIGREWMDRMFYDRYPMEVVEKPNGCSRFDKTYYVATIGNDNNSGELRRPLATIQKAVDLADSNKCTKIHVLNGIYLQTINIKNKKNITIFGNNRITTQILSKKKFEDWEDVSDLDCGSRCKMFKTSIEGSYNNKLHLLYKDKVSLPVIGLARISFREVITPDDLIDPSILTNAEYIDGLPNIVISNELDELTPQGKEKFKDHALHVLNTDTSAFRYLRNTVMNRNDLSWKGIGSSYYVHQTTDLQGNAISEIYFKSFDQEEYPQDYITTHLGYNVTINDSHNIVIQNLNLQNGRYGVLISRDVDHVKVIGNIIGSNHRSVYIVGGVKRGIKYAPSNIEVFGNQITGNLDMNMSPQFEGGFRNFNIAKTGLGDTHGVYVLNAGSNINIHHNFIYNVANGVQSWNDNAVDFRTIDLKVHHNLIINTIDDALEPGGSCINCRWYANHLRNTSQGIRIKLRDTNSVGPVFIYNNVLYNQDKYDLRDELHYSNQTNFYYHTASNTPLYIYNNLFLGFRCFMMPTGDSHIGGPNTYFINNIFSCRFSLPKARIGAWPSFSYGIEDQVYDENNNALPMLGSKNEQPLFSHNIMAGVKDHREQITSSSGNLRALYDHTKLHIFAKDNRSRDLNIDLRSQIDEEPVHIFSSFNEDRNILERMDFCPRQSQFEEFFDEALDLRDSQRIEWNYVEQTTRYNREILNQIDREISYDLPLIDESIGHIGPFAQQSQGCSELSWLLEE